MIQIISNLCEQLKRERIENSQTQRGRSPAKYASQNRDRSRSTNRTAANNEGDITRFNAQIVDLRRNVLCLEEENEKLRGTMKEMVDDYTRQLELRDDNIKRLEGAGNNTNFNIISLKQEVEDYKHENRMLKEKTSNIQREYEMGM